MFTSLFVYDTFIVLSECNAEFVFHVVRMLFERRDERFLAVSPRVDNDVERVDGVVVVVFVEELFHVVEDGGAFGCVKNV